MEHTAGTTSQKLLSTTTCMFEVTVHRTFNVVGDKSTGTFKGATGSGAVTLVMTADLPKLTNGTCDESTAPGSCYGAADACGERPDNHYCHLTHDTGPACAPHPAFCAGLRQQRSDRPAAVRLLGPWALPNRPGGRGP